MNVRDAMSQVSAVVGPEHTLREAAARMVQHRTGAAVVMDGTLPGPAIITERDLLLSISDGGDPDAERVEGHMKHELVTASPDWPLSEAATLMVQHGVRHVLVFEGSDLVGILSMRDVVRVAGLSKSEADRAGAERNGG